MPIYKNKVIWITGASSGIGAALAQYFAKAGGRLILSARRQPQLEEVKQSLNLPDENVLVLPLDLGLHDELPAKVDLAMAHFGQIDYLINNGGISQRSLIVDTDFSVYKRLVDIDYLGTVALTKAVLPVFIKQQSGHFSVVTSLMGKFSAPLRSGYCGAKHALHGFFDALRMEHEKDNVQVLTICPGFIHTDISMNALSADGSKQNSMDKATKGGLSAEGCAAQIAKAIKQGKYEVLIGGKETFAVYLKRFFPRLLHRVVMRSEVT
ncbi:MAG: dehydrogenase/reductase SDR family protein 7 [Polaribacter sp.]|jgi:dehydrogenase/reductase SDR family protein 7